MEFRPLGSSGIMVSALCVGTMTFGKPLGEAESGRLVSHALDMGINFFDTANVYEGYDRVVGSSGGVSEELLGKALLGRRQEAVVCTKLGNPVGFGPMDGGLSARHLEEQLEKSLRHLKTDWIDLVLAHRWVAGFPVEEVWRVFDRWVCAGKVLSVGISNWPSSDSHASFSRISHRLSSSRVPKYKRSLASKSVDTVSGLELTMMLETPSCDKARAAWTLQ